MKKFLKRLLKIGGLLFLVWLGVFIGYNIGENQGRGLVEPVVIRNDDVIRERIVTRADDTSVVVRVPDVPGVPDVPEPPAPPEPPEPPIVRPIRPVTVIEHGPGFFDVVGSVANGIAALALIWLGVRMVMKNRRGPVEKTPESLVKE